MIFVVSLYRLLLGEYQKDVLCADYLKYGRKEYDYQENTLVFVSPGQVFGHPADGSTYRAKGWCLYFSPELLRGTGLGRHMKDYTFFSYDVSEALHLSLQERETLIGEAAVVWNADRSLFCRPAAPVGQLFRRPDKKGDGQVGTGICAAENHGHS